MYRVHYARSALHMFAYVMCVWWVRVRCLKLDPLASMGWFVAAWALLAVAPGPFEPEARYGFPSGNVSSIPDFPVTLDGTSRAVFRLDEICSVGERAVQVRRRCSVACSKRAGLVPAVRRRPSVGSSKAHEGPGAAKAEASLKSSGGGWRPSPTH